MKLLRLLKRELSAEAASWVDQEIITAEQAGRILRLYGTELPSGERKPLVYYILLSIAALFMGLSVIVLVSANWDHIPRGVRMTCLIAITLLANSAGLSFFKAGKIPLARIWFFLGSIIYGATIFLIAQIYHLGEHYPDGVFYWAIGVLPVAFLTDSILIMLLAGVLSGIWLILESQFGFFPFFYPVYALSIFWFCFRQRRSLILFLLAVAGSVFWLEVVVMHLYGPGYYFDFGAEHVFFTTGIFILLHWAGGFSERFCSDPEKADYGLVLRLWTIRFGILTLFIFSFEAPWYELIRVADKHYGFILGCTIGLPVLLGFLLLTERIACSETSFRSIVASNIPTLSYAGFYCLCNGLILYSDISSDFILQILTNLMLLMTGIWLIIRAYKTSSSPLFYMGTGVLIITALLRYIDLIGDYVGGAIAFFIAGCIMLAAARLWKRCKI
ncbi:DUF2157 domain-containing protein [Desulfococcaceae bacterium HSG8]|nr:DUF2157 domain-containing protein [Desulfococcaceae bacterium HSG8]